MNTYSLARAGVLMLAFAGVLPSVQAKAEEKQKTTSTKAVVKSNVASEAAVDAGPILAKGPGGIAIKTSDILAELQRAPEATRKSFLSKPDQVRQLVSNLLVRRALAREGEQAGLLKDPLVVAAVSIAMDRVLSDVWLAQIDAKSTPTEAAMEAYAQSHYKAEGTRFDQPAQSRARHILIENKGPESLAKTKELLAQLRAGASFEELAKANSTDAGSAAKGGDLGFFSAGKMVKPFEDAVNALAKPGDLSEPVETQFGYHIIRLEERREKGRQPFAEVRDQLLNEARNAIMSEARVAKVMDLNKSFEFDQKAIEGLVPKN